MILCNVKKNLKKYRTKLEEIAENLILDPILACLAQTLAPKFFCGFYLH